VKRQYLAVAAIGLLLCVGWAPGVHGGGTTDSGAEVQVRLNEVRAQLAGIKSLMSADPQLARDDYTRLGVAIAERFIRRVETGGPDGKQSLDWSSLQVNELEEVLDQTEARMKAAVAPRIVPQPTGGSVTVTDGVFYTDTTIGKGSPAVQRPYYFGGYGVFGQVAADIPNFRDLGVTVVSQERGPNSMNPDGTLNDGGLSILDTLKSAAENGIKVDLLLSPHYFPQWAIDQTPDMAPTPYSMLLKDWKDYVGFPNYHIDHPKAREVIQKWLETIVSAIKDEPALFSLCLANEANNINGGRDPHSRPRWIEYLKQQHQTIGSLNALYSTNHKSFEEVPVPPKEPRNAMTRILQEVGARRAYFDWVRFNQYHFADWFRWMDSIIKRLAPDVPTHIKVMSGFFFSRALDVGNDPELLCQVTDLAGNDCVSLSSDDLKWEELWYDLLHSFRGQPTFNSENHFIVDDSPAVSLPPSHIRSVLWQGALHHEGATTLWVWEEPGVPWLAGSIYLRPANMYAAGRTMLDLNRLAPEVAAVSQAKPKVALLYSMPSWVWQEDYVEVMKKAYTALLYIGQPVTFVSEQQLAENRAAKVDWIFIPHATHVHDTTVAALEKFVADGGRVVMAGNDSLVWDEYERQRTLPPALGTASQIDPTADEQQMRTNLRSVLAGGGLKLTTLRNVGDGELAWGVEYRVVPYQGCVLVPMINFLQQPQIVRLSLQGSATDLLSDEAVDLDQIRLQPMQPRLLRWVPGHEAG